MLKALIKKDFDREKQMLVAVGTIRTCLEVHFLPHLDRWKQASDGRRQGPGTVSSGVDERRNDPIIYNSGVTCTSIEVSKSRMAVRVLML